MIVNLQNMWDLSEGLSQVWLVEMAGIIMKISMGDVLLVPSSPSCTLAVVFTTHRQPLLEKWNLLP